MSINRRLEAGRDIGAYCTRCKRDLTHTILAMGDEGLPERVRCNTCGSEHRYIRERSAPRLPQRHEPTRTHAPSRPTENAYPGAETMSDDELLTALRDLLTAAGALPPIAIADRWQGGTVIIRPGRPGLQEKEIPIDTFFKKIVMVRDRLRVLEQQVNSHESLSDAEKLSLQQYITRCYGSLTTFNFLFADREDWFVGQKSDS